MLLHLYSELQIVLAPNQNAPNWLGGTLFVSQDMVELFFPYPWNLISPLFTSLILLLFLPFTNSSFVSVTCVVSLIRRILEYALTDSIASFSSGPSFKGKVGGWGSLAFSPKLLHG